MTPNKVTPGQRSKLVVVEWARRQPQSAGRASVPASPNYYGTLRRSGLAGTLTLPIMGGLGLGPPRCFIAAVPAGV
jgi:hypothetical protein